MADETPDSPERPIRPKEAFAEKLALGWNIHRAAKHVGIPDSSARRLANKPEVKRLVARFREAMFNRAVGLYARLAIQAAMRLEKLLKSENDATALRAARDINEAFATLFEKVELAAEVARLRSRIEPQDGDPAAASGEGPPG